MEARAIRQGSGPRRSAVRAAALIALGMVIATPPLPAAAAAPGDEAGQLVRLADGRRINLRCLGRGSPTVLLESGFGADSRGWGRVRPTVAARTRVCSYDRAGAGYSDPGPMPRDGAAIARDLDQALRRARINGPFIVVGHSAGGLYGLLFAARRASQVKGLVLVDPSVPFQTQRLAQAFGPGAGSIAPIRARPAKCLDAVEARDTTTCAPNDGDPHRTLLASRAATWRTQLSELDTLFTTTSEQVMRALPVVRRLPLTILTASKTGLAAAADDPGGLAWEGMHRQLAATFDQGVQRPVKSGHLMMVERPDVVAAAILDQVDASRH